MKLRASRVVATVASQIATRAGLETGARRRRAADVPGTRRCAASRYAVLRPAGPTCGAEPGGAASCCSGASLSGWKVDPLKVCQLSAGSRCTAGRGQAAGRICRLAAMACAVHAEGGMVQPAWCAAPDVSQPADRQQM